MSRHTQEGEQYLPTRGKRFNGSLVQREAVSDGIQTSIGVTAGTGLVVGALHFGVPAYRRIVNLAGSAFLVGAAGIGTLLAVADARVDLYHAHPELYRIPRSQRDAFSRATISMAEVVIDKPLQVVGAFGVPAIAAVAYRMSKDEGVSTSRKVMHTRVVGQAALLGIIMSIMATQSWSSRATSRLRELDAKAAAAARAEDAQ